MNCAQPACLDLDPLMLREFLTGTWLVRRRFDDRRLGLAGRFVGVASFVRDGEDLHYAEHGRLRFGAYRGPASQRYDFVFREGQPAELRFPDGRHFHDLVFRDGRAEALHHCGADLYRGRYALLSDAVWTIEWLIAGPRKDLRIVTRYRRVREG